MLNGLLCIAGPPYPGPVSFFLQQLESFGEFLGARVGDSGVSCTWIDHRTSGSSLAPGNLRTAPRGGLEVSRKS